MQTRDYQITYYSINPLNCLTMNRIKLTLNTLAIEGARVLTLRDENGRNVYYVGIPATSLFIPRDAQNCAYLNATMYETPNSQFSDFAIKPYVNKAQFDAMSQEQRNAVPFIGKGVFVKEQPSTSVTSQAITVDAVAALPPTDAADNNDPFGDVPSGTDPNDPIGAKQPRRRR